MKIPNQIMPLLFSTMPLAPKTLSVTVHHADGQVTLRQVSVPADADRIQEEGAIRAMLETADPWLSAEYNTGLMGSRTLAPATLRVTVYHSDGQATLLQVSVPFDADAAREEMLVQSTLSTLH